MTVEGDAAVDNAGLANGAEFDIRPPTGEEWEIWNLFAGDDATLYRVSDPFDHEIEVFEFTPGTTLYINDGKKYRLTRNNFLRITNTSGGAILAGYAGVVTGVNKTGAGTVTQAYQAVDATGGTTPYIDIRPPAGAIWLIDEIWTEASHAMYRTPDGANFAEMIVNAGAAVYNSATMQWVVTNDNFLQLRNTNVASKWLGYAGKVLKA